MFGIVLGLRLYQRHEQAAEAERRFAAGEYETAKAMFASLGDTDGVARAEERMREAQYLEAQRLLREGDYEGAEALLVPLRTYRESAALLRDCAFLRARALAESGQIEEAQEVYITLGDYPGCAAELEALRPALYDRALELAYGGAFERACALWRGLGSYRDSLRLLQRGERILARLADPARVRLNDPSLRFDNPLYAQTYVSDEAYILFPETPNADTRFFLYFPGGRNEELYSEFLYYYMENPAPNTLAVFMRRNGLPDMDGGCARALSVLEAAAGDCGLFVHDVLVAGSSLGAYPALQCPRIARRDFGIRVPCVLSLDAGNEWGETRLVPTRQQAMEIAESGAQLYLFQPTWVDTAYAPIHLLVETGNWVMLAGCLHDEHDQISYDVLGMGVIDWALGDRSGHCPGEIFTFRRLKLE